MHLDQSFFNRHVVDVAQDLLGNILVFGQHQGIITETEAYRGADDPASHAFKGITPRSRLMFGEPGYSYVYLIYGMYHCLNITTEPEGSPSAVLIRGLRMLDETAIHLNGPGKLCRHLGIALTHNGIDMQQTKDFYITEGFSPNKIQATPRIGIRVGTDKLWRFVSDDFFKKTP